MSQGSISDTLIRLEVFITIFVFRRKVGFFPRVLCTVFGKKNDEILKSAFFTSLCPYRSWSVVNLPWESFLMQITP